MRHLSHSLRRKSVWEQAGHLDCTDDSSTYLLKWGCQGSRWWWRCCCCCCTICTIPASSTPSKCANTPLAWLPSDTHWVKTQRGCCKARRSGAALSLFVWNETSACVFMPGFDVDSSPPLALDPLPAERKGGHRNQNGPLTIRADHMSRFLVKLI